MKTLAPILMILSCLVYSSNLRAEPVNQPELLKAYADLLSLRSENNAALQGGQGVMVLKTKKTSPFQPLDIILTINTQPIQSVTHLHELVSKMVEDKQTLSLQIMRGQFKHTIQAQPGQLEISISDMMPQQVGQFISVEHDVSQFKPEDFNSDSMISQYLKGRPYRTPNNRSYTRAFKNVKGG